MSRTNAHVHESRRLHRALSLGLSGAALVGLIYFEGLAARAEAGPDEELAEELEAAEADELEGVAEPAEAGDAALNDVPSANPAFAVASVAAGPGVEGASAPTGSAAASTSASAASLAAAPADGRLAMATLAEAEAAAALPVAPPAPALVVVPDIEGMSLRKAKKQLAARGLKLAVRDEYGEKIPREYWSEYKVRKQKLDAGTEVEPGSIVKVKARVRVYYAQGY